MKNNFLSLKQRAKKRNLEVTISYSQYIRLKNSPCEYCGIENYLLLTYCERLGIKTPYMTIDRKDNTQGYTPDNTVACCFVCNRLKGNVLSYEEMKEIAEKYLIPKVKALEPEVWDEFEKDLPEDF